MPAYEARYVNNSVLLLAQASRKTETIARVRAADNVIAGETRSGKLILPAPLDYIPWVKSTEELARRADLQGGGTLAALLRHGDAARGAGTGSARLARKR